MSVQYIPPLTPLLYRKAGVCRGIHIFLIFDPKHTLWVLVRTASAEKFLLKIFIFYNFENIYIAWAIFRNGDTMPDCISIVDMCLRLFCCS